MSAAESPVDVQRSGYSLLEILIATTILAIGLAAIFELTQSARRRSQAANHLATAQLACQTTLNELLAKQSQIAPFSQKEIEGLRSWKMSLEISPTGKQGLSVLHLKAQEFLPQEDIPTGISYQLLRWVPDQRIAPPSDLKIDETNEFSDPFQ